MRVFLLCAVIFGVYAFAGAADSVVVPGQVIDEVVSRMAEAGVPPTVLQIAPEDSAHTLRFWQVGQGTLVVSFANQTGIVQRMTYLLLTDEPRSLRKQFVLNVIRFIPCTAELVVQIPQTSSSRSVENGQIPIGKAVEKSPATGP